MRASRILLIGLCCLAMTQFMAGCIMWGMSRPYPRIRFDLEISDPTTKTVRYFDVGVEASNLRYYETASAIKRHFYLSLSNGLAYNKEGDRVRPCVIGRMHLVLSDSLAHRQELPCRLTMGNGIEEWSYQEVTFDPQGEDVVIFSASEPVQGEIVLTDLSWIKDEPAFKDRRYLDELTFHRFRGTLAATFRPENKKQGEDNADRQISGPFRLRWRREDRGS